MASAHLRAVPEGDAWERIIHAALEDFGRLGFRGAQVEHIARKARVSKQSIYYYFTSKDLLYQETITYFSKDLADVLSADGFDSPDHAGNLRRFFGAIYDFYADHPNFAQLSIDFSRLDEIRKTGHIARKVFAIFAGMIDRAAAGGSLRPDFDKMTYFSFASYIISGSFIDPARAWAISGDRMAIPCRASHRETVLAAIENLFAIRARG